MREPLTSNYMCVITAWRDSGHPFFLCEYPCLVNPHWVSVTRLCAQSLEHLPAPAHPLCSLLCPCPVGPAVSHVGRALNPKAHSGFA